MFTDVCPQCVKLLSRKKPVAGIKNIVTEGFGVRGQCDIIDFQSMPDGLFKYLLNYLDHGVKKLTSIPLTSKRASSVAFALLTIFTEQGPRRFFKLTTVENSPITHTTMSVKQCSWMMSSLILSSRRSRIYGQNARWFKDLHAILNPMEALKG